MRMTNEEAIAILDRYAHRSDSEVIKYPRKVAIEAFEMAIEALKQEPCEDAISREAAITAVKDLEERDIETYGCKIPEGFDATEAIKALRELPSVNPASKTGKWIVDDIYYQIRCMQCGHISPMTYKWNFCPFCGAEMREGDEE